MAVIIDSGRFPLVRNIDFKRQPERMKVLTAWSKVFHDSVPDAVEHLADVIEDVYSFELWKEDRLSTPEQFFERLGLFDLDLENPAKLIRELRKKRSSKRAQIIARAERVKRLRDQGKSTREIAAELGVGLGTVSTDLRSENRVMTPKTEQPPRQRITYQVSNYTKPETAARKLREKFGAKWCDQLKENL